MGFLVDQALAVEMQKTTASHVTFVRAEPGGSWVSLTSTLAPAARQSLLDALSRSVGPSDLPGTEFETLVIPLRSFDRHRRERDPAALSRGRDGVLSVPSGSAPRAVRRRRVRLHRRGRVDRPGGEPAGAPARRGRPADRGGPVRQRRRDRPAGRAGRPGGDLQPHGQRGCGARGAPARERGALPHDDGVRRRRGGDHRQRRRHRVVEPRGGDHLRLCRGRGARDAPRAAGPEPLSRPSGSRARRGPGEG